MRPNSHLLKATLVGALGGLIFGFDIAVVSGIIDSVVRVFGLSGLGKGLTVAVGPVGTVIGCFAGGVLGQRIGPRTALRYAAGLYFIVALASALAVNWPMLLVLRFFSGLGLGSASVLGPVYIAELAPAQWRGRLVGAFQINVVIGLLIGYASDYFVHLAGLGAAEWRTMIGAAATPALLLFILLFHIPPSPRWLASRQQNEQAVAVLAEMGASDPRTELAEIQSALEEEHSTAHEPVFQWKYRFPLFLAITIGAFNQLAGVNAVWYYAQSIFAAAGFSASSGFAQTMVLGATNLVFAFVGMALIDHFGRKSLLIAGAIGTTICLSGISWIYATNSHPEMLLGFLVVFIAFFAASQGAVIWVYIGEVFPTSVRSKGQGVGNASHWIANTIISLAFPFVVQRFSVATPFIFFAGATLVQLIVVSCFYPETKGRTLEDLQRKLVRIS